MTEPPTYKFTTFQELMDRVPGDRIRDCMRELGEALAVAKMSVEAMHSLACDLADKDGVELPPQTIKLPDELEWIDDHKGDIGADIVTESGDPLFRVQVTKGEP